MGCKAYNQPCGNGVKIPMLDVLRPHACLGLVHDGGMPVVSSAMVANAGKDSDLIASEIQSARRPVP